jgi:hypothetical protein
MNFPGFGFVAQHERWLTGMEARPVDGGELSR